jgi:hypothetical protein
MPGTADRHHMEVFLFYLSWLELKEFLSRRDIGAWAAELDLDWIQK